MRRSCLLVLVLGWGWAIGLALGAAAAADLSSPAGARRAYALAHHAGDAAGMKAVAIYDAAWERVIDAAAAAEGETARLRKAASDRWGAAANGVFPELKVEEIEGTAYRVTGETAALTYHGTVVQRFRLVEGKWRVDLVTPVMEGWPDRPRDMVRSSDAYGKAAGTMAGQIAAGRFATPAEAYKAFDDLRAVLFDPASAATRPGVVGAATRSAGAGTTRPGASTRPTTRAARRI